MTTVRAILTLGLVGCAGFALAQSEPPAHPAHDGEMPHFDLVDTDNDGFLSIEEARVAFNDLYIEDTDGDGLVSKGEAEAALPGLRYTNDAHEDVERRIGPADYVLMAEYFLRGRVDEGDDH